MDCRRRAEVYRAQRGPALFLHALGTLNRVTYDSGLYPQRDWRDPGRRHGYSAGKMFSWRVFGLDYVWAQHNFADLAAPEFSSLRRPEFEGVRLRTGMVINWGGAERQFQRRPARSSRLK